MVDDTHTRVIYNMWNVACHTYIRSMSLDVIYIYYTILTENLLHSLKYDIGGFGGGFDSALSRGSERVGVYKFRILYV